MAMLMLCVVFVIDCSGFTESWKRWLSRWLKVRVGSVKPFDCSLCMTFWGGVVLLSVLRCWSIGAFAYVCICALFAKPAGQLLAALRDGCAALIERLNKQIDKLWLN